MAALIQFIAYMKGKKRLSEHHSGNRAQHVTGTMKVMMTDKFLEAIMNKKMLTLMVLLDLSKAFGSFDHAKLLAKLSSLECLLQHCNGSGATCMIASSIYELALKCLEYENLHTEFYKDPS